MKGGWIKVQTFILDYIFGLLLLQEALEQGTLYSAFRDKFVKCVQVEVDVILWLTQRQVIFTVGEDL